MERYSVIAFSGSLRHESYTTKLVKAFGALAPEGVTLRIFDIKDLPFINEDLENDLPGQVRELHAAVEDADAVLLATPEYNRSYSPILKNALDWGSRPDGKNAWDGKPTLLVGTTFYQMGAFGAQNHLRQVMMYLNMQPVQQPEFYMERSGEKFDDSGNLTDEHTKRKIAEAWAALLELTRKMKS